MEFGPHTVTACIIYRYLINTFIIFHKFRKLDLPWLTSEIGTAIYFLAFVSSLIGLLIFVYNVKEGYETKRFWKSQTGKEYTREMWVSDKV